MTVLKIEGSVAVVHYPSGFFRTVEVELDPYEPHNAAPDRVRLRMCGIVFTMSPATARGVGAMLTRIGEEAQAEETEGGG